MTCGLVHASYSLPEWQAKKLTFFAPWTPHVYSQSSVFHKINYFHPYFMGSELYGLLTMKFFSENSLTLHVDWLKKKGPSQKRCNRTGSIGRVFDCRVGGQGGWSLGRTYTWVFTSDGVRAIVESRVESALMTYWKSKVRVISVKVSIFFWLCLWFRHLRSSENQIVGSEAEAEAGQWANDNAHSYALWLVSSSASACDSDNVVFTWSQVMELNLNAVFSRS